MAYVCHLVYVDGPMNLGAVHSCGRWSAGVPEDAFKIM